MDVFGQKLNEMLVGVYRQIDKIEEESLKQLGPSNLSISELHLLEAVGKDRKNGRTISDIAQDQDITLPSVTAAVNKLARKGYVEKIKGEHDGRVVYVRLTRLGRKMDAGHRYFHENMVRNLCDDMSQEEKEILVQGINKLSRFLYRKLEEIEENRARAVARAEAELVEVEPNEAEPIEAELAEAEPFKAELAAVEPNEAEAIEAEPSKAERGEEEATDGHRRDRSHK